MKQVKSAILLAAGLGTRLRPLTDTMPKCLVPINQKPLLIIWIEQLQAVGIERIFVNTHYFADAVVDTLIQYKQLDNIILIHEEKLLGTAGTVKHITQNYIFDDGSVLVAHADNVCICDWKAFFEFHQCSDKDVSLMAFETDKPSLCGILECDEYYNLLAFHEKKENPPGNLANAAIYLFSDLAGFFNLDTELFDISLDVIPNILPKIKVWVTNGYLRDIGSLESYQQALRDCITYKV
ncbi:nucleotidyltransferase family protein [Catenovulum sp. 2E275]|uniref:nucleotidyltransferase family protein n=1 Tax=Catenovulum sp. 2E275 TaxID=2980497 RepID=UPI0021CFEEED|nr:nucleotidyltransferase family protein [Catenovulum sp. 2E275]MCU4674728.1 nucleotidyltransferase family protein [Catenovulum sp. 2E275]